MARRRGNPAPGRISSAALPSVDWPTGLAIRDALVGPSRSPGPKRQHCLDPCESQFQIAKHLIGQRATCSMGTNLRTAEHRQFNPSAFRSQDSAGSLRTIVDLASLDGVSPTWRVRYVRRLIPPARASGAPLHRLRTNPHRHRRMSVRVRCGPAVADGKRWHAGATVMVRLVTSCGRIMCGGGGVAPPPPPQTNTQTTRAASLARLQGCRQDGCL